MLIFNYSSSKVQQQLNVAAALFFGFSPMEIIPVQKVFNTSDAHARLPFKKNFQKGSAYVNHKICSVEEASVPITDLGFTRADAVYDVVTVSGGKFFRLHDHQQRFEASLEKMYLSSPFDFEQEAALFNKLIAVTGLKDAYLWWGVTRGATPSDSSKRLNPGSFENRYFAYVIPIFSLPMTHSGKRASTSGSARIISASRKRRLTRGPKTSVLWILPCP